MSKLIRIKTIRNLNLDHPGGEMLNLDHPGGLTSSLIKILASIFEADGYPLGISWISSILSDKFHHRGDYCRFIHLAGRASVGGVPLPEPPGEPLDVARHRGVEVEARQPAERPVPEHPLRRRVLRHALL